MARTIGPYELIKRLAVGGSAEIYLARKSGMLGFEQHYALKVLLPHYSTDEDRRKMMIDEARLTAQLDHPNIVKVHDLGEEDGTLFMVMEYVNGLNLAQVLTRLAALDRTMPIEAAVFVVREACGGLHYAHTRKSIDGSHLRLVHRDVSPQNVLIGFGGGIKLVDFGVAKAAGGGRLETKTGIIKGKLTYMAPEYAVGSQQDHRSDVFAAGLCLYEMLTGRAAYDIEDARELVDAVKNATIQRPSKYRDGVPPGLEKILEQSLEKVPDKRWETAHEMQKALSGFLSQYAPDFRKEQLAEWMQDLRESSRAAADSETPSEDGPATIDFEPIKGTSTGLPAVSGAEDEIDSLVATQAMDLEETGLRPRKAPANRLTTVGMPGDVEAKLSVAEESRQSDEADESVELEEDDDIAATAVLAPDIEIPPMLDDEVDDEPTPDPGIQVQRDFLEDEDVANAPTGHMDVSIMRPDRPTMPDSELPTAMEIDVEYIRQDMVPQRVQGDHPQIMTQSGFQAFATRPPPAELVSDPLAVTDAQPAEPRPINMPQAGEGVVAHSSAEFPVERLPAPMVLAEDSPHEGLPAVIIQQQEPPPPLEKRLPGQTPPEPDPDRPQPKLSDSATALVSRFGERYEEYSQTESGRKATDAIIVAVLGSIFVIVLVYIFFFGD